jgi:hypothetical protein
MLATFGSLVIKLEPKHAGDIARGGPAVPGGETSDFVPAVKHARHRLLVQDFLTMYRFSR